MVFYFIHFKNKIKSENWWKNLRKIANLKTSM